MKCDFVQIRNIAIKVWCYNLYSSYFIPDIQQIEEDIEHKNCNQNSTLKTNIGCYPDKKITVCSISISKKKKKKKKEKATDTNEDYVVSILKKKGK